MRTRYILGTIIIFICCLFLTDNTYGQQQNRDSLIAAQNAKKDSIAAAQQRRADSIAAVKSYLKSKQYNDSIDAIRKARMDSIRAAKQRITDSIETVKIRRTDSINAARQRLNDSLQAAIALRKEQQARMIDSINEVRERRADSIAAVKAYRNSKHFKDSVAREKQQYIDSVKKIRQQQQDSIRQVRQLLQDSMMQARQQRADSLQAYLDSMRTVRELRLDSLREAQMARKDSLAKVKELREAAKDKREDEQKSKKRKVIEDKIKKKQDEYSNDKMLKKKWSFLRRAMQNTTTRYNYYFNAKNKMKEAEDNMFRASQDNFDSLIALYPFDPDRDSTKLASDMDSLIKRISVGIQIHDPRAKWQDDLFLLLGKAYYYRGDYKNAAAAFQYIVANAEKQEKEAEKKKKNTKKGNKNSVKTDFVTAEKKGLPGLLEHNAAKNEAILWLSRVYTQTREYTKAQILLDMVSGSPNLPQRLRGTVAFNKAFFHLSQHNTEAALPYLDSLSYDKNTDANIRERAGYIAGQLYQRKQQWDNAAKMYSQVIALHPPVEMEFKAQIGKLMAQEHSSNSDKSAVLKQLTKLSKESKYSQYFDQIHYSIANLHVDLEDKNQAIKHYNLSIQNAKNNLVQKGMSYYKLGNVHYYDNNYLASKRAYDSALAFLQPQQQPMYDIALQRSNNLSQIATPGAQVQAIDSLLSLAKLSERDQRQRIRQFLKAEADAAAAATTSTTSAPSTGVPGNPNDWYFNNATLAAKGETDFKQKWGNRPLKDNWRRAASSMDDGFNNGNNSENISEDDRAEQLFALIPKSEKAIDSLNKELEKNYYLLGKAFFHAEDYINAEKTYDTILKKYPLFQNKADILYDKYIIAVKSQDESAANTYKQQLMTEYPNHEKTSLLAKATPSIGATNNQQAIMEHYDHTYQLLTNAQFKEVLVKVEEAKSLYPAAIATYQNRYNLMKAVAYAGIENYEKADTLLTEFIAITPNDSLKSWANTVHKYVKEQLKNKVSTTTTAPIATTPNAATLKEEAYEVNKSSKHTVILYTTEFDGKFMGVKAGITDYNSLKNSALQLNTSVTVLEGTKSLIIIKEFSNANLATKYLNELKRESQLFKDYKIGNNLNMTIISEQNLQRLQAKKDFNEYLRFFHQNY